MSKPIKTILPTGKEVWEVYLRESGRTSRKLHRRFDTRRDAERFIDEFKTEQKRMLAGQVEVGSFLTTTFKKEADNWLSFAKMHFSPGHYRRAEDILKDFNRGYGSLEPNKVTPDFLSQLQMRLKERSGRKDETTWANSSVNKHTEVICAVLNFSSSQKRIPFNPSVGFKKLPKNSVEVQYWNDEEASSFLAWANQKYSVLSNKDSFKGRKNYVAYLLALNTGMRAGEIWGLKPRDLCFNEDGVGDTILVRRQFNAVKKDFAPLKGEVNSDKNKSRHVPCPPHVRSEIEILLKANKTHENDTVFQNSSGKPVSHDAFAERFERDIKQWAGRRIRFHDLRHTAATLMLAKGVDVRTVKEILGHEDMKTTLIYVHLLGDRIRQVSRLFSIQPARPKLQLVSAS